MQTKWTFEECKAELAYIQSINPANPGGTFNHDPSCFARYCDMQSKQMDNSRCYLSAHDVDQCGDVARNA